MDIIEMKAPIATSRDVYTSLLQAKADYENKLVEDIKTNPKKFYNYTRLYTSSSSTVDSLLSNGTTLPDDTDKANLLNEFFGSVMTTETL